AVGERLAAPGLAVLDVGAGAAPWSLAIARRSPGCRVTAVDLPPVLVATGRAVTAAGLRGVFDLVAGDVFEVPLAGEAYDRVVVGSVCHLFGEERNRRLLARANAALRAGGVVALIETLPDAEGGALGAALHALSLLVRTS